MKKATLHINEQKRLDLLKSFKTDDRRRKDLEELTELACKLTNVPNSFISIVDVNTVWFKSQNGIELNDTPRELSFCAHAINHDKGFYSINDTLEHPDFENHPYVIDEKPIRSYAGVPLKDKNNLPLGTICVLDYKPHQFTKDDQQALELIADLVMRHLTLYKVNEELKESQERLKENNELLKEFARTVSHDMKMPLANMVLTTDLVAKKYGDTIDQSGKDYLKYIKDAAFGLSDYVTQILSHYESDSYMIEEKEVFDIYTLLEHIQEMLALPDEVNFILPEDNMELNINKSAMEQILINLIGNAQKYNDKEKIKISISAGESLDSYKISVRDNGMGIPEDKKEEIFKMFSTLNISDRLGKKGNGIGLNTVLKLVEKLNGSIDVKSELGKGTEFIVTLSK
ncbi:sensor histidine kinase [Nonlabens sp.]|uniref:sensor histidine kinase n=1 Tax=Nonlabens sp. TaxID=1888209 RepID=UPI003F69E081